MKEQHKIPISKVQRAAKFVGTGAKMGGNYLKYYAKKIVDPSTDRESLDEANAADVYESLSQLKGSALKVAQMMSMDQNVLPKAYTDKFQMAQYNAPPLSFPLVVKTFRKYFGKSPEDLFDSFTSKALNAASIGQVHQATLNGKKLAVKIQYPGVAHSVSSDLKLAKPIAMKLMNVKGKDLDKYIGEVEEKLLEETDYTLELKRSIQLTKNCASMDIDFPKYYPEYSSERVITMDWIDGMHLSEWIETNPSQADRDRIGQNLWDFYNYQIHKLHTVHADPHPGNFIITESGKLAVLDFGCVKEMPLDFYSDYFKFMDIELTKKPIEFNALLLKMEFLFPSDSDAEREYFTKVFGDLVSLLCQPFSMSEFDFSDKEYFAAIYALGDQVAADKQFRKSNAARGSKHGIYINRTYFGLYNILHLLQAKVNTKIAVASMDRA
ncbi:MAG: AarF/ABC1/UbiB kinase family protein [Flavobacteriales bacterium]|nr:AarF/ABC1/UbiB kinase family protein [Flavobacteriales bacterium]